MKKLVILLALLCILSCKAHSEDSFPAVKKGKCYPSYPFGCVINQKVDENHFGMVCNSSGVHSHGILQLKKVHSFPSGIVNTGFEFAGTRKVELQSGFDATVDLWRECTFAPPNGE
jgi:hypothetical protein